MYSYKGKMYSRYSKTVQVKCPITGNWYEAVQYKSIDQYNPSGFYIRELKDFEDKFKEVVPEKLLPNGRFVTKGNGLKEFVTYEQLEDLKKGIIEDVIKAAGCTNILEVKDIPRGEAVKLGLKYGRSRGSVAGHFYKAQAIARDSKFTSESNLRGRLDTRTNNCLQNTEYKFSDSTKAIGDKYGTRSYQYLECVINREIHIFQRARNCGPATIRKFRDVVETYEKENNL